jgi:signal transduction histidine kinase
MFNRVFYKILMFLDFFAPEEVKKSSDKDAIFKIRLLALFSVIVIALTTITIPGSYNELKGMFGPGPLALFLSMFSQFVLIPILIILKRTGKAEPLGLAVLALAISYLFITSFLSGDGLRSELMHWLPFLIFVAVFLTSSTGLVSLIVLIMAGLALHGFAAPIEKSALIAAVPTWFMALYNLIIYLCVLGMAFTTRKIQKYQQKKIEEANSDLILEKERSFQSARLASLGDVTGGIAHEINNPLAIVKMALSLLQSANKSNDPTITKVVNIIDKNIDRITALINTMHILCGGERKGTRGLEPISVKDIFEDVVSFIPGRESVSIDISSVSPYCNILGDKSLVSQAIIHILDNAIYFSRDYRGSSASIKVWADMSSDDDIEIFIADNGKGVSLESESKIFDPFFTSKPIGTGPGLGLSVSYAIIQKMNGSLILKNRVDPTIFVIRLPRAAKEPMSA